MGVVRKRSRDAVGIDAPYLSDLELLILDHAAHRGALQHAVLEGGVVFQLDHRQLAAHAPSVEDEAIGVEHGVLAVGEPLSTGQQPSICLR